jgi:hypothetical protein
MLFASANGIRKVPQKITTILAENAGMEKVKTGGKSSRFCLATNRMGKPCGLKDQIHPNETARFAIGEGRLLDLNGNIKGR